MTASKRERWQTLLENLDPKAPPTNMAAEYVRPVDGCAQGIADELALFKRPRSTWLLGGAIGGGKSTELRELGRLLLPNFVVAGLDLDALGFSAPLLGAHDLLYLSSIAVTARLPEGDRKAHLAEIRKAYAPKEQRSGMTLEKLLDAVKKLSGFGTAATLVANAAGFLTGFGPAVNASLALVASGLQLISNPNTVVSADAPAGAMLLDAATKLVEALAKVDPRPVCVLIDGLEKMNGQANERFRKVFEHTQLLRRAPWAAVFAAPACTLAQTNAAEAFDYKVRVVWGFPNAELGQLAELIERRLRAGDLDPAIDAVPGVIERIAKASGGRPRVAIQITLAAITNQLLRKGEQLSAADVDAGIRKVGEDLARGVGEEGWNVLVRVHDSGSFPEESIQAASLFGDGRIIALPPAGLSSRPRWAVHPLLVDDVNDVIKRRPSGGNHT